MHLSQGFHQVSSEGLQIGLVEQGVGFSEHHVEHVIEKLYFALSLLSSKFLSHASHLAVPPLAQQLVLDIFVIANFSHFCLYFGNLLLRVALKFIRRNVVLRSASRSVLFRFLLLQSFCSFTRLVLLLLLQLLAYLIDRLLLT